MKLDLDLNRIEQLDPVIRKTDVVTIDDFLTADQCQAMIDHAEANGFEAASVRTGQGAKMMTQVRNNDRFIFDDAALASEFWRGIEMFLDAFELELEPVALNERFRFYRYDPAQRFKRHRDGEELIGGRVSKITALIYLNDDCEGGATVFTEHEFTDGGRIDDVVTIQPRRGTLLMFRHHLWHEGQEVTSGRKYVLRTDVLCRQQA